MVLVDFQNTCKGSTMENLAGKLTRTIGQPHLTCTCPGCDKQTFAKTVGWTGDIAHDMWHKASKGMAKVWDESTASIRTFPELAKAELSPKA